MKNTRKLILFFLLISITLLSSCRIGDNGGQGEDGGNGQSGDSSSVSYRVITSAEYGGNALSDAISALESFDNLTLERGDDSAPKAEREILWGRTNREISETAYMKLGRMEKETENSVCYLVYSDGASVAVAFEEDALSTEAAERAALDAFLESLTSGKTEFSPPRGTLARGTVDFVEYQRAIDIQGREMVYENIRTSVILSTGDAELADNIVSAFREYYALTTPNIVSWLANLYEPDIDAATRGEGDPMRGGFYFSNSGRDTEGFLPDLESTSQAIMIMHYSGLLDHIGGQSGMPDWFKEQVGNFAKSLQDPNGFFYHPQWGKDMTDRNQERRARDAGSALSLIGLAGKRPTYNLYDTKGDGTLIDGTRVDSSGNAIPAALGLTGRLGNKSVAELVSSVISAAQTYVSPELLTKEAFLTWLEGGCGYKIENGSYGWGSFVCSRDQEYLQRDKQLAEEGANWRVSRVLIDFLNEHQNPENGTWEWGGKESERYWYNCVNGLLKIGGIYTTFGVEMPHALEACQTAINAIGSNTTPIHICDVYNPWFAVSNTLKNLSSCAANPREGREKVAEVRKELLKDAPSSIINTLVKRSIFKKDDGSFSYFPESSSQASTGMPVALKDMNEGDVNATVIAAIDIRDRMCAALGLPTVDILGKADYLEFMRILESLQPVIKKEDTSALIPLTFDDYSEGELPNDSYVNSENLKSGGICGIIADPRENSSGNVFRFETKAGKGDILRFPTGDTSMSSGCAVFEADMCFEEVSLGYTLQLSLDFCYMVGMRFDGDTCYFFDTSSQTATRKDTDFVASCPIGEWFNIRIEYYPGDEDTVRAKVYLNGELIAVSDNYYDFYGYKVTNGEGTPSKAYSYAEILGMSGAQFVLLIDNVTVGRERTSYKAVEPEKPLAVNVDAAPSEKKVYDFDSDEVAIPEDFGLAVGQNTVEIKGEDNKALYIKRGGSDSFKLDVPAIKTSAITNLTSVSMDLSFLSADVGAGLQLGLHQRGEGFLEYAVTGFLLKIEEEGGEKFAVIYESVRDVQGAKLGGIKLPVGTEFNLRIDYYDAEKTTLIYIDGTLMGLSSAVAAGVEKYNAGELVVKSLSKTAFEARVDNLSVEKTLGDFMKATKPTEDRITYSFNNASGFEAEGAATLSGGKLILNNGGVAAFPLNRRSIAAGTVVFSTEITLEGSGDARIILTDSSGAPIVAYTLKQSGGKVYIHEATELKTYDEPIASFKVGKRVELLIEYYTANDLIQIFIGTKCVAVSSLRYNDTAKVSEVTGAEVISDGATVTLDELFVEAYNKLLVQYNTSGVNTEDGAEVLGFESSTGGNIPSALTYSFGSGGAAIRVDEVMKAVERSKALVLETTAGGADTLTLTPVRRLGAYGCLALEADLSLAYNGSVYLYFRAGGTDVYRINLNMTNGSLHIDDNPGFPPYGTMGNPDVKVGIGKWARIRIELYNKADGSVAARIGVNGKFLAESNEPSWKGAVSSINSVNFTTNTGGVGVFMLDGLFFGGDAMTLDENNLYFPEPEIPGGGNEGGEGGEGGGEPAVPTEKDVETYEDGTHKIVNDGSAAGSIEAEGDNHYYSLDKSSKTEDYLYIPKSVFTPEGADCTVFETRMRIVADGTGATSVNIIYGRWNGMKKFTLSTASGSKVIKLSDWRDGASTTLSVDDTGAKLGEWFTLRIENYLNEKGETVARVYINGINLGESTNAGVLGSVSELHNLNNLVVKANNNIIGSFDLDDTYFGLDLMIVPEEKKPVEDFEDGVHSITLDGGSTRTPGTIVEDGDNSYYNKPTDTSDYLYIRKSSYEPEGADCIVFEAKLRINHMGSGACSFKLLYGTWKGMDKFTFYNPSGADLSVYDSRSGVSSTLTGGIGAKIGEWFTLRIENYLNEKGETVARLFVNGTLIGESTNIGVLGAENANHNLDTVSLLLNNNIRGTGADGDVYGSVDIDDVYLGADKMTVLEAKKPTEDFEDEEADSSVLTSSPSVATSIDAGTATATVRESEGNKYLEVNKTANGTAALYFNKGVYTGEYDCYVFEADLTFDVTSADIQNNLYIYAKTGSHVHRLWLYNNTEKPGEFFLLDYWAGVIDSSTLKVYPGIALTGEVRLRVEYFNDAEGKLVARVYANGVMVGESRANITASFEDITRNDIWLTGATLCTLGVDNVYSGFDKMIADGTDSSEQIPE